MKKNYSTRYFYFFLFFLFFISSCSTVKISKEDSEGNVNAFFQKIKVRSNTNYRKHNYQIEVEDLYQLWESDNLVFVINLKIKESSKRKDLPSFVSLQIVGGRFLRILDQKEETPTTRKIYFSYTLKEVKKVIEEKGNLILSVNKGELFFIISNRQLNDLYKELIKGGFVLDL